MQNNSEVFIDLTLHKSVGHTLDLIWVQTPFENGHYPLHAFSDFRLQIV